MDDVKKRAGTLATAVTALLLGGCDSVENILAPFSAKTNARVNGTVKSEQQINCSGKYLAAPSDDGLVALQADSLEPGDYLNGVAEYTSAGFGTKKVVCYTNDGREILYGAEYIED